MTRLFYFITRSHCHCSLLPIVSEHQSLSDTTTTTRGLEISWTRTMLYLSEPVAHWPASWEDLRSCLRYYTHVIWVTLSSMDWVGGVNMFSVIIIVNTFHGSWSQADYNQSYDDRQNLNRDSVPLFSDCRFWADPQSHVRNLRQKLVSWDWIWTVWANLEVLYVDLSYRASQ